MNKPTPQQVRQLLADVHDNIGSYADGDLLEMKHSADVLSHAIKIDRRTRDARAVDEACRLEVA